MTDFIGYCQLSITSCKQSIPRKRLICISICFTKRNVCSGLLSWKNIPLNRIYFVSNGQTFCIWIKYHEQEILLLASEKRYGDIYSVEHYPVIFCTQAGGMKLNKCLTITSFWQILCINNKACFALWRMSNLIHWCDVGIKFLFSSLFTSLLLSFITWISLRFTPQPCI